MKTFIKSIPILASALVVGTGCTSKPAEPQPEHYLYLAIGQSNMVGKGIVSPEDSIVSDRFLNLSATDNDDRKIGEWRKAIPGNCRPGTNYPQQVSLTDHFGRTMIENLPEHITIGVLQVGVDGCPMRLFDKDAHFCDSVQADWMEGQINAYDRKPYERLISLAKKAQAEGWQIKGLLVHQGETDAYSDYWPNELKKVYHDILNDLQLKEEDVPVLVGEAVGADQNGVCAHANPTLDRVHDFIPTAWTISSYACEVSPDYLHFSANGYHRLGRRYAIKMLQLMGKEIADDTDSKLQIEVGNQNDAFHVDAVFRILDQKIVVSAAENIVKVDIASYSGATLEHVKIDSKKVFDLDIKKYTNEDRFVLNIHSADGKIVNRQVDRIK